jgi:hypothetical protein
MIVAAPVGGDSALRVSGLQWTFNNGSATTLNGNLLLDNVSTVVQVGADFTGGAALINLPGRRLLLSDGVLSGDFNVLLINQGLLHLGALAADGQAGGKDFQQTGTGMLHIDLGGVALNAFDRFNLTGAATLSGALDLALIGGFVPAQGQTFNILTAPSGISGTFSSVSQPAGMPGGLAFTVHYMPFIVQLAVVTSYEAWIDQFGITDPWTKRKGADPEDDGTNNLGEFALDGHPSTPGRSAKSTAKIAPVGGVDALTLTLPVRVGAVPDPADPAGGELVLRQFAEGVAYTIQASENFTPVNWTLTVTEVVGADAASIQAGFDPPLPALHAGWIYRTFRSAGPVAGDPEEFMRIKISE